MQIMNLTPIRINTPNNNNVKNNLYANYKAPSFGGTQAESKIFDWIKIPLKKIYNSLVKSLTKPIAAILKSKRLEDLVEKTKNSKNLVSHITALTATVLSGFYIKQTLENEKLDKDKRTTLAVNQAATTVASTALSYTVCKALEKKIAQFTHKFLMLNHEESYEKLEIYDKGIKSAASIMIFMTIYRFIAPVLVTPIANHIGNKIQEKKEAELANRIG